MKNPKSETEFLPILKEAESKCFQAGLTGKVCIVIPELTEDTTEGEELQMIYEDIENLRMEQGQDAYPPEVLEVLVLFYRVLAISYREGLAARNLSKECSSEKESA